MFRRCSYLAKALCEGGLPVAEVTFRTACAKEAIIAMKKACPQMIIGAGTVLNPAQVNSAIEAGSEFIVSPGLNPRPFNIVLIKIFYFTWLCQPKDMEQAIELGLDVVKFFPAQANGGLPAIKAMSAPYCNLKFMPTGGINTSNLTEYLAFDKIIACGGLGWSAMN
ncbi:MAG: bifunctional 4-hydroxy-2-oxoglutarate aldolase/2-dehydro-3-deoxy-phosphogluconate aldolase [Thomasclavelia ramosa]